MQPQPVLSSQSHPDLKTQKNTVIMVPKLADIVSPVVQITSAQSSYLSFPVSFRLSPSQSRNRSLHLQTQNTPTISKQMEHP